MEHNLVVQLDEQYCILRSTGEKDIHIERLPYQGKMDPLTRQEAACMLWLWFKLEAYRPEPTGVISHMIFGKANRVIVYLPTSGVVTDTFYNNYKVEGNANALLETIRFMPEGKMIEQIKLEGHTPNEHKLIDFMVQEDYCSSGAYAVQALYSSWGWVERNLDGILECLRCYARQVTEMQQVEEFQDFLFSHSIAQKDDGSWVYDNGDEDDRNLMSVTPEAEQMPSMEDLLLDRRDSETSDEFEY